jgi:hypothetical protein
MKMKRRIMIMIVILFGLVGCSINNTDMPKINCYPPSENQVREIGSVISVERREALSRYSIIETDMGINVVVGGYPIVMSGDKLRMEKIWQISNYRECGWKMIPCVRVGNSSECSHIVDSDIQFKKGIYR